MILTTNKDTLQSRIDSAYMEHSVGIKEMTEAYLRRSFDSALVDSTALAVIQLALEMGHIHLAEEMQNDYNNETSNNQN